MKFLFVSTALLFCVPLTVVHAQDESVEVETVETTVASENPVEQKSETPAAAGSEYSDTDALEKAKESASGLVNDAKVRVGDLANTLDKNRTVQDVSTSILNPIYVAAESIAFPAFHWIAFALMATGVVSYAFQLVFGKLVVLTKGSINIREIISDTVGLLISGIGLILTTQAATENSTFPESPTGVLSAAAVGVVLGFILYRWNQAEEIDAAHGRKKKRKRTPN